MEDLFSRKNILEEIRLVAKNNSQLENNKNFICKSLADNEEIAQFFKTIISINLTLRCDETIYTINTSATF
ncbi:hypothetical protein RhiirA1_458818 [Rhizophagus irregularis]|uniref:Uncharacterized protein n=2 Tax=Rhizophagus irregularis TaxID=588596 RepID=A0A2I1F9I8_9GLOM|nr:hypothetical protein RhiirA1_458818 [Rhizophagus irregularis]PKY31042.1 hypothetical protein RhiirB3_448441 [Rhizophagus irregularis]GET61585.1 hypothetical protein GLOIN_2v1882875 [Rhizophagus irregularis DAOM 181602=DAOM 197198]